MHDNPLRQFPYAVIKFDEGGKMISRNQLAETLFPETGDSWAYFSALWAESRPLTQDKNDDPLRFWVRPDGQVLFATLFRVAGSPNKLLLVSESPDTLTLLPPALEEILEDLPTEPASVTKRIAAIVQKALSFERLDMLRVDRRLRNYVYEYSIGLDIVGVVRTAYSTIRHTGLGWIFSHLRPHLVEDFSPAKFSFDEDPKLYDSGFRSILRVPIVFDQGVVGAILLGSTEADRFDLEDALLTRLLAQHVASAFFQAGAVMEREYQARANAILLQTVMTNIQGEPPEDFLCQYCLQLLHLAKAGQVGLFLLDQRKNLRRRITQVGKIPLAAGNWEPLRASGGIREMLSSKSIVAFNLADPHCENIEKELGGSGFTAILYAPVENENREIIAALVALTSDEQALSHSFAGIFRAACEQLSLILSQAHLEAAEKKRGRSLLGHAAVPQGFGHIVGSSPAIRETIRQAATAAKYDFPILLTGETGTGKELFAKAIHESSAVAPGPFIVVNSAAIPGNLLESELFGYQDGAFTGGVRGGRKGKILLADGGTLFFDEIGELSPELQAKILRVVQEQEVEPLGSAKPIPVHVRIISATHRGLDEMVQKGQFRADLLYRLNAIEIKLPPLRERGTDVVEIAEHLLQDLAQTHGVPVKHLSAGAKRTFLNYTWPGNIRQLQNVINRLFVFVEEAWISENDLPGDLASPAFSSDSERDRLEMLLREFKGNKTALADYLGITRTGLWKKLKRLGLQ
ncbi:transcriptional regulatory protein ZraR [Peptococcaceae bacterium CEB3]|nr:transcriptional regulatory protein ZraR [Peptococcaceae bacterium CEB3]